TRSLDQIWLRIGRAVHPTLPAPEEVDLVRARHVELEPVLLDSHRAARGRCHPVPELRGGLRACHVDRHSRERAVENANKGLAKGFADLPDCGAGARKAERVRLTAYH